MPFKDMPVTLNVGRYQGSSEFRDSEREIVYVPWEKDELSEPEPWAERLFGVFLRDSDTQLSEKYWSVMEERREGDNLVLKLLFRGEELCADAAKKVEAAEHTLWHIREGKELCLRIHTGETTFRDEKSNKENRVPFYALLLLNPRQVSAAGGGPSTSFSY